MERSESDGEIVEESVIDNAEDADDSALATAGDIDNAVDEILTEQSQEEVTEWEKIRPMLESQNQNLATMTATIATIQTALIESNQATIANYQALSETIQGMREQIEQLQKMQEPNQLTESETHNPALTEIAGNPVGEVIKEAKAAAGEPESKPKKFRF